MLFISRAWAAQHAYLNVIVNVFKIRKANTI
jgi:hypothetical protein